MACPVSLRRSVYSGSLRGRLHRCAMETCSARIDPHTVFALAPCAISLKNALSRFQYVRRIKAPILKRRNDLKQAGSARMLKRKMIQIAAYIQYCPARNPAFERMAQISAQCCVQPARYITRRARDEKTVKGSR